MRHLMLFILIAWLAGCTSQHNIRIEVEGSMADGQVAASPVEGAADNVGRKTKGKAAAGLVTIIINQNSQDSLERPKDFSGAFQAAASTAAGTGTTSGPAALTTVPVSPVANAPVEVAPQPTTPTVATEAPVTE